MRPSVGPEGHAARSAATTETSERTARHSTAPGDQGIATVVRSLGVLQDWSVLM